MKWWFGPIVGLLILIGIAFASCNVTPTTSPISPLTIPGVNLLVNAGFDLPTHYQPKGETSMVLPTHWEAFSMDAGGYLKLYEPAGMRQLGRYTQYRYGLRPGQDSELLKAEILHISFTEPNVDPPRVLEGGYAVEGLKLFGHVAWGVQQSVPTIPGHVYRLAGDGHAWSRMSEDPNDPHFSHGVGTAAFYAEEGSPLLNDNNDNYRFRLCADVFGAENVFGSAVQCGVGAIVYNVYHALPPLEFVARADSVTVFAVVDSRFGYVNSNAYLDSLSLTDITQPPTETPTPTATPAPTLTPTATVTRRPTVTPIAGITLTCELTVTQRVFILLPPQSGPEWYTASAPVVAEKGWSIGTSAVDACLNSCARRIVIAVNVEQRGCNLYKACSAPCGSLSYIPLSATDPSDLASALARYPEWLHEAWGLCLPAVMSP